MEWRKIGVTAATVALAATMLGGCSAPGSSKTAVSFAGKSYTQGQVEEATNQLNDLIPAQTLQQVVGAPKLTRMTTMSLLLYTPALEKAADKGDLDALNKTTDKQVDALVDASTKSIKPTATTREALRNLLLVSSGSHAGLTQAFQQEVAKNPPQVNERYGKIDWAAGGAVSPNVPSSVHFNQQATH